MVLARMLQWCYPCENNWCFGVREEARVSPNTCHVCFRFYCTPHHQYMRSIPLMSRTGINQRTWAPKLFRVTMKNNHNNRWNTRMP